MTTRWPRPTSAVTLVERYFDWTPNKNISPTRFWVEHLIGLLVIIAALVSITIWVSSL